MASLIMPSMSLQQQDEDVPAFHQQQQLIGPSASRPYTRASGGIRAPPASPCATFSTASSVDILRCVDRQLREISEQAQPMDVPLPVPSRRSDARRHGAKPYPLLSTIFASTNLAEQENNATTTTTTTKERSEQAQPYETNGEKGGRQNRCSSPALNEFHDSTMDFVSLASTPVSVKSVFVPPNSPQSLFVSVPFLTRSVCGLRKGYESDGEKTVDSTTTDDLFEHMERLASLDELREQLHAFKMLKQVATGDFI